MARKTQDEDNKELESILVLLLEQDIDVTAREIARRHSALSSASTITRHPVRRQLVEDYKKRQSDLRGWLTRVGKRSKQQNADLIATQGAKIVELDHALKVLAAGHLALIAAVAQVGGMRKLLKYYEQFRDVRAQLSTLNAIPADLDSAENVHHAQDLDQP